MGTPSRGGTGREDVLQEIVYILSIRASQVRTNFSSSTEHDMACRAMRFINLSRISPRKLEEIMKNSCLLEAESTDGDETLLEASLMYQ